MKFILPLVLFTLCLAPAFADDAFIGDPLNPISYTSGVAQVFEHDDQDVGYGFKGFATIYVVNDSDTAWSDFHVSLFKVVDPFGAIFKDAAAGGYNPTYTLNGVSKSLSYQINNAAVGGPTLDMVFNDFVQIGDTAVFKVYTDNMATKTKFGLSAYPTSDYVVPEPSGLLAIASAVIGLGGLSLRRRK